MNIRVLGGGWYGAHIALSLLEEGHEVVLHETADRLFAGASAANPARLHLGFHYPRSKATRVASQANYRPFMDRYGDLTRGVPVNIYALAAVESLVDFGNYVETLTGEVDFVVIERPEEFGLKNVEGAVLTGERHILVNKAREYFTKALDGHAVFGADPGPVDSSNWDVTIDCTFCSLNREGVERYEPCVTYIFEGPYDKAVTIMDGQFPSVYPHYEPDTVSLTSALNTPLARCKTTEEARAILDDTTPDDFHRRRDEMMALMSRYYPAFRDLYRYLDLNTAVRAMPGSGADSRILNITRAESHVRLRAGKIDAIFTAEERVKTIVKSWVS